MTRLNICMKQLIILCAVLTVLTATAKQINCPARLKWSSEGYCKCDIDPHRTQDPCPAQSHLAKPSVLRPMICQAKGGCEPGYRIDYKLGQCVAQ